MLQIVSESIAVHFGNSGAFGLNSMCHSFNTAITCSMAPPDKSARGAVEHVEPGAAGRAEARLPMARLDD